MSRANWIRLAVALILALIVILFMRLHVAAAEGNAESGRVSAQAWCTECHSVQPETAGTGKFAPDFSAIAKRRSTSARSLKAFLQSKHKIMPDFVLTSREADDIVAYILSLKRG